ncbi:MAG: malonic semialdehyde reductase [Hydrotalea sp.]|nr:malonic semialdehyde reductase [Hydrotalea sp.]
MTSTALSADGQKLLFTEARTFHAWQKKPVEISTLHKLYDLMKWAPTSLNSQPAHFVFLTTDAAKARLVPFLLAGNVDQTKAAPVTVIVAYDTRFHEHLPKTFPAVPTMKDVFEKNPAVAEQAAFRNGSMQGGYFILAARALGLDTCGMSGFDNAAVDKEFFPDGRFKSNFLCNIGYGDAGKLHPRGHRHGFDIACKIL